MKPPRQASLVRLAWDVLTGERGEARVARGMDMELVEIGVNLGHRQFNRDRDAVIERSVAARRAVVHRRGPPAQRQGVRPGHSQRAIRETAARSR